MNRRKSKKASPTVHDIAKKLGVHPSTVSRALNPRTRHQVGAEVAKQALEIAARLGYRRNQMASALRTGRSDTIGVVIPDLKNLIFPPIIQGLQDTLGLAGYLSLVAHSDNDLQKEHTAIRNLSERRVDGFLIASAHREDALIENYAKAKIPMVLVLRTIDNGHVDSVVVDEHAGMSATIDHLVSQGHENIAYIAGPQWFSTGHQRYQQYLKCMEEYRLEVEPDMVVFARNFTSSEGYSALNELFSRRLTFTAIVTGNDLLALGCLAYLQDHGISCPEKLSVIGYGDMPLVDQLRVPLTTVAVPKYEIGVTAGHMLLEQLRNPIKELHKHLLQPKLVIRKSTAPPTSTS